MRDNVLITGADKGLGYAMTEEFLKNDYKVFACLHRRSNETFEALKERYGESIEIIEELDVADENSVKHTFESVQKYTDSIDILINNAGVHFSNSHNKLEDVDFDTALQTFNINSLGPLRVTKHFAGLLEKGNNRILVNISSEAGSISANWRDREYDYCMSKAALNMQSAVLQKYFEPKGIKVLVVHPGWMKTDMGGKGADITAETSAKGILELAEKYRGSLDGDMYMDYAGKKMSW